MQKVQVFLRSDQKAALKSIAVRTGRKQSDLIREGIDLVVEKAKRKDQDWREVTRAVAGIWKDRTDLEALYKELRERTKRRFPFIYERA